MTGEERRGRAKYLRLGDGVAGYAPRNDTGADGAPAFTVTRGELRELVREAVREATPPPAPPALDREGLATALGCGVTLVDKLRKQGMPSFRLGDSPRFELERCLEWLRKDGAA